MKLSGLPILKSVSLAVLSSRLLLISFPKFDLHLLAWVGHVPPNWNIFKTPPRRAFFLSFLAGFLFFILVFKGLLSDPSYPIGHHALICCYLALSLGIYELAVNFVSRWLGLVSDGRVFFQPFDLSPAEISE